jgi:hypothetical protein
MSSKITVSFENPRFKPAPSVNDDGSLFLGFQSGDLTVPGVLPGGEDLVVTLKDLRVSVDANGHPDLRMPYRTYTDSKGEKRNVSIYWIEGALRSSLIEMTFAQHSVQRTYRIASEMLIDAKEQSV